MKLRLIVVLRAITTLLGVSVAAQAADAWKVDLEKILSEYMACGPEMTDDGPCNVFLARALKRVYGIDDFLVRGDAKKAALLANEIAEKVSHSSDWHEIGALNSQEALNEAAEKANEGCAVIAVVKGNPNGHVALVLPGKLQNSPSWNLSVPNSACFFIGKPHQAYIGKPLSKAFARPDGKVFYRPSGL